MIRCGACGNETPVEEGKCSHCGAVLSPGMDSEAPTERSVDDSEAPTAVRDPSEDEMGVRGPSRAAGDPSEDSTRVREPFRAAGESSEDATDVRESSRAAGDPDADLFEPGHSFGERYRIIRVLGTGGMGAVYHAWDEELGIGVALKVIRMGIADDASGAKELEERFKRELLLARAPHEKEPDDEHDEERQGDATHQLLLRTATKSPISMQTPGIPNIKP